MKKVLLSAVAILGFTFANAQEEEAATSNGGFAQGDVFVTGAVSFGSTNDKDTDVKTSGFTIEPKIGFFVTENIAVGGKLGYMTSSTDNGTTKTDVNTVSAGAFGRYYFTPANQFSLFGQLGLDYMSTDYDAYKVNGLDAGLGLGMNYFVSSNFSIEAGVGVLGFNSSKADVSGAKGSTGFNFGGDWRAVTFGVNYKF